MADLTGYDDTPTIPGTEYCVHDPDRPDPEQVTPGDEGLPHHPPSDATVLFDATDPDLSGWESVDGGPAGWDEEGDAVVVAPDAGDVRTEADIGDCQLHVEWATPTEAETAEEETAGEGRGNSGVFLMDRYEIQVFDNYNHDIYADGYTGGIYGQHPPLVDVCRPPGEWQSFDLVWHRPRFSGDDLETPARATLFHNGVLVLDDVPVHGPTRHRTILDNEPHGPAPLRLQDHGDRVRFRNAWYRPLEDD
jgi:hypothetical protein